jgi:hypothetical protein
MIKRKYFISVKKPFGDGSASMSTSWFSFNYTSLFPDHDAALEWGVSHSKDTLSKFKGSYIQVVAFNRIK